MPAHPNSFVIQPEEMLVDRADLFRLVRKVQRDVEMLQDVNNPLQCTLFLSTSGIQPVAGDIETMPKISPILIITFLWFGPVLRS